MQTEWEDIILTIALAYSIHKTQNAIKTAARLIRQRVKEKPVYEFLSALQLSPAPLKSIARESSLRFPQYARYFKVDE